MLGLSEEVAGVTLVALGNGAPDIFAGIVFIVKYRPLYLLNDKLIQPLLLTRILIRPSPRWLSVH